ncbi:MAG TPA: hypothetical protein VK658_07365 [Chryseolinea sp.]|nr:hypothetical protein [Chryseolinea sp.]
MPLTKVLITVKTYPTLSTKYEELVCTAGFREDGTWVRIYPIQFRQRPYAQQYKKYQWIELDLVKNEKDFRPESFRPVSHETAINLAAEIPADGDAWHARRKSVLGKIYHNLVELIAEAKNKSIQTSLAVFKPTIVKEFVVEAVEREWSNEKLASLLQLKLFSTATDEKSEVVRKLPYKFSYRFEDNQGSSSQLMIEDWEIGALFWKLVAQYEGDENRAIAGVRAKYFDDFAKTKDLHFFLGTTFEFHLKNAPNPFVIIGTFHPKAITQTLLF